MGFNWAWFWITVVFCIVVAYAFTIAEALATLENRTDDMVISEQEIYVVWCCKTLQNNKALLSTPVNDGMYYELTYNGNKKELYLDAYKKAENVCYTIE